MRRDTAVCIRCQSDLEKTNGRSIGAALACSLATLLLLVPVNVLPLLRMDLFGMHSQNITAAGVAQLWGRGWILLAGLSALFVILFPFLRFGLLSAVLAALRLGRRPSWLGTAFRWSIWLDPWAMIDVYLLAGCVGYYRLINIDQARVTIELGGACFIAAAFLTMLSRATLDTRTVWRAIGGETHAPRGDPMLGCTTCDLVQPLSREGRRCPRCGAKLRARKLDAARWTAALLIAALVLIFPANIYPMNISDHLGQQVDYTIMTGVQDLFKAHLYPLGVLIFCTSILFPAAKIFALGWCVLSVWRGSRMRLVTKTKVLRVIAEMGRWSKTDPFAIVFFVPLVHFGSLGSEDAGWGATAFMMMTFLTMVASVTFDPRLMWDVAQ
ncbi:MAG TPA: paraquat-inducible protein A [Steroidobacteraceae bacterium]|nr:paraquat-inducible protein A [Steroidobacteraceae bacterium]